MPKISALIHAHNDAHRLGRTLETLRPCDEIIVIDHGSDGETAKLAREYGATVRKAILGVEGGAYAMNTRHEWVLCLRPDEIISEALEATLFEWKRSNPGSVQSYALSVRQQSAKGWQNLPAETRLVNRSKINWKEQLPPTTASTPCLEGDLLRFPDN
jgi:glycosyltransferase involved in cell wall biosynthesis